MGVKMREKVKGSGEWWIFVNYKGQRKSVKIGSKAAAKTKKEEIEGLLTDGKLKLPLPGSGDISFKNAADRWIKEHVNLKLKPSSKHYYDGILTRMLKPEFDKAILGEITRADIKAAVAKWNESGTAVRSIPNALRTLRAIFAWAMEEGLVTTNPCLSPAKIFKVKRYRGSAYRADEAVVYLDTARRIYRRCYAMFRLMVVGGLREGEIIALTWDCVDLHDRVISVEKTSWRGNISTPKDEDARYVPISEAMAAALRDHWEIMCAEAAKAKRKPSNTVFVNLEGHPFNDDKLRKMHKRIVKTSGLRYIRLQDLRGTQTSNAIAAGVPLFNVARMLGHSSTSTTERHYAHLVSDMREAPEQLEQFIFGKSAPPAHPGEGAHPLAELSARGNA